MTSMYRIGRCTCSAPCGSPPWSRLRSCSCSSGAVCMCCCSTRWTCFTTATCNRMAPPCPCSWRVRGCRVASCLRSCTDSGARRSWSFPVFVRPLRCSLLWRTRLFSVTLPTHLTAHSSPPRSSHTCSSTCWESCRCPGYCAVKCSR